MADEVISTKIVANADFSGLIADVHKVTASLSKLQENLANSNKMLANNVAVINRNFADTIRSTGQFSSHFVSLTSDVEKFGKNLDTGRLKLRDYFNTYQGHIKTSGGLIRDLARQQVAMQNAVLQPLGRNAQGLMQFNVHVPRGLDAVKNKTALARQELAIMNKVIQDGSVQLINWGKNTQWAGRQLTVGLTLPIAAFGKAAADAFKVADQELTRLTKVYGDVAGTSAQELGKVRAEVTATAKELSAAYGTSFSETISLAADIAATGKQGQELLDSVKETSRLAVLGEVDRQEAMKATLAIQSAFKANTEELTDSINFLNAVENQTSTTLNDLVEAIPKAGPVIKGLGGSVQDLALYLTAMREGGISASEGANALKSALASLINPTDKAVEKFKTMGIDLLGIVNQNAGNVTGTLMALQAALDNLDPLQKQQAIEQLFGKFQFSRLNALFENLGRQGSQTLQVLDLMKASTSDLANVAGRELTAVTESASGKYRRAIESLKADLASIGEEFLTIGTKIITVVDKALEFFNNLPKPIKTALTFLGALTAVAGPLIMLTGLLANFFGYILKGAMHMKAFFKGGEGWKYLTPEMIAAEKAGKMLEQTFYSDAKAASILQLALKNLIDEFSILEAKAKSGAISVNPAVSTMGGNLVMGAGGRVVNPQHPLAGPMGTRASTHMVPRASMTEEQRMAQTIFGLVPGSVPVNRKIGDAPQIYMNDPLPPVPGLTTVGGVSTGVVSGEAARWHSMMATLAMQSKSEIEALKKQIATTGVVSKDFMNQFDDILPVVSGITDNAAKQSSLIVAELRAGKLTVEQARAQIIALNLEIERMITSAVGTQAAAMGRTLNPTVVPTLNQPVVDATGKSNMRELFKKSKTRDLIDKVARSLGVRTSGAGYNIETTRPRKMNMGGYVYGLNDGSIVPGPNVNADVVPAMLTPGEFVVNREAAQANLPLLMAINGGIGGRGPGFKRGGRPTNATSDFYMSGLMGLMQRSMDPDFAQTQRMRHIIHDAAGIMQLADEYRIPIDSQDAVGMATDLRNAINRDMAGKPDSDLASVTNKHVRSLEKMLKNRYGFNLRYRYANRPAGVQKQYYTRAVKGIMSMRDLAPQDRQLASKIFRGSRARFQGFVSEHVQPFETMTGRGTSDQFVPKYNIGHAFAGSASINQATRRLSMMGMGPDMTYMNAADQAGAAQRYASGLGYGSAENLMRRENVIRSGFRSGAVSRFLFTAASRGRMRVSRNAGGMIPGYNRGGLVGAARDGFYTAKGNSMMDGPGGGGGFGGAGFMTGLGLQMAGGMVGGQAGMGMQIAGTAMQLLPMISGLGKAAKAATSLTGIIRTLGSVGFKIFTGLRTAIAVLTGPIGLASLAVTGLIMGIMKWRKEQAETKRDTTALFGITEKGAKEVGIKYETLTDKVKLLREEQKLAADKARQYFESYTQTGVTGLTLTIKQLKELKERVKTDMPETMAILNNIDSSKVNDWAANLKAQMVSSGKSVEEATNLIYALIESSNKAGMGVSAIANKAFTGIQDKGSAASFVMQNLAKNINDVAEIDPSAFAANVDSAISSLDSAVQSLIGTKDASGDTIDQAEAIAAQFEKMTVSGIKNKKLGEETLAVLKAQRPEFASILNKSDTIGGMYAKWRLLLQGVATDLSRISSSQAETLATFTAALDAAGQQALANDGTVTGLEEARGVLKSLRDDYAKAEKASRANSVSAAGLSKQQIKAINDEIKAIRERADAKKRALRETFDRENAELELQQAKLDLQNAIARGDNEAAAAAQIRIQQIQKESSLKAAEAKIDENARKAEAKQQAILDKDAAYKDALQNAAANAGNRMGNIGGTIKTIEELGTTLANVAKLRTLSNREGATQQEKDNFKIAFANALQDIAKAAKSDPKVIEAYKQFFVLDSKGKAVKDAQGNFVMKSANEAKTVSFRRTGETLNIPQGGALTELDQLASSMTDFATQITGGTTLREIYNILAKGQPKQTTLTFKSDAEMKQVISQNAGTQSAQYKNPYDKDNYLTDAARKSIIFAKKLVAGDTFTDPNGNTYVVKKGYDAVLNAGTAVRKALGGMVRRAANGITGMSSSQPYLVGERGPELFVPSSGGQIIPNNILGARYNIPSNTISGVGGSANNSYNNNTYTINIELNGTNVTPDDIMRKFKAELALINAKEGRSRSFGGSY